MPSAQGTGSCTAGRHVSWGQARTRWCSACVLNLGFGVQVGLLCTGGGQGKKSAAEALQAMAAENEAVKPRLASAGAIRPLVQMVKDGERPLAPGVIDVPVVESARMQGGCSPSASAAGMLMQQPCPAPGGEPVPRGEPALGQLRCPSQPAFRHCECCCG